MEKIVPRPLSRVELLADDRPYRPLGTFIFLGEIPNWAGRCVILDMQHHEHFAYTTENVRELKREG